MFPVKEKIVLALKRNDGDGGAHEYHAMLLHDDGNGGGCAFVYSCGCKYKQDREYTKSCTNKRGTSQWRLCFVISE